MATRPNFPAEITTCGLRILATSDVHAHLVAHDYYADQPTDLVGLVRTASVINTLRADAPNTLLFENGDFIQGTPLGDYAAQNFGKAPHPMIDAMNMMGYDAGTIGNHEFNYGLEFLSDVIDQANFPFTLANVETTTGEPIAQRYLIIDKEIIDETGAKHTIRVGVIGFTPPQITTWDRGVLAGRIVAHDIVETAQRYVPAMKRDGADIIVALCHSGISDRPYHKGMENAAGYIGAIDGIDAIITGHSHLTFPSARFDGIDGVDVENGTLYGTPAVMPGLWGSHVGIVDLVLEKTATGWARRDHTVGLECIYSTSDTHDITPNVHDDPIVAECAAPTHTATLAYIQDVIGRTTQPLQSYFSLVQPDATIQTVAQAQLNRFKDLLQDTKFADLPILSAASPFKSGGRGGAAYYTDIPAGPLAIRDIASLYLYPNLLHGVLATGREVFEWLERSASMFNQVPLGAVDAPLLNPAFPTYNFDTLFGLTYEIDLSQPPRFSHRGTLVDTAAKRIKNTRYNGELITDDMEFAIATNNYRAAGGGDFPLSFNTPPIYEGVEVCRNIVLGHISKTQDFIPEVAPTWSFAPLHDTSVIFDTGLGALKYINDGSHAQYKDTCIRENGFARLRFTL